jgi:tetratricopeptide (TPR) repeat protein
VLQALKIDETLADAHSTLAALYLFHDWNWEAAERELKQALSLDVNVARTWNVLGFCQAAKGRLAEALASMQRAHEVEPLVAVRRCDLAKCYNWLRRHDEAIAEAQRALELEPGFPLSYSELGLAYIEKKMYAQAITELRKERSDGRLRASGLLGYAYAKAGQKADARKVVAELGESPGERFGCAFAIARIQAALGDKDQAFLWLQRACAEHDPLVVWLKVDPTMDDLRSEPQFNALLKGLGLPP